MADSSPNDHPSGSRGDSENSPRSSFWEDWKIRGPLTGVLLFLFGVETVYNALLVYQCLLLLNLIILFFFPCKDHEELRHVGKSFIVIYMTGIEYTALLWLLNYFDHQGTKILSFQTMIYGSFLVTALLKRL